MSQPKFITGKTVETYSVQPDGNPIEALINAILKPPERNKRILGCKDPRLAIEYIKKHIQVRRMGEGINASWLYMAYVPQFDVHFRILAVTRLAEDLRYNPF